VDHLLVGFFLSEPSTTGLTLIALVDIGCGTMNPSHLHIIRATPGTQPTPTEELPVDMTAHVGLELEEDLFEE
jgi:hypothetical protein